MEYYCHVMAGTTSSYIIFWLQFLYVISMSMLTDYFLTARLWNSLPAKFFTLTMIYLHDLKSEVNRHLLSVDFF